MTELEKYPPVTFLELPPQVALELVRFVSLIPLSFMDFRLELDKMVTASDASTYGGGVTASSGLTEYGHAPGRRAGFGEPLSGALHRTF